MVTITPTPLASVDLPTEEQLTALMRMVEAAHPQLRLPEGQDPYNHHLQFGRAMFYCAYVRRHPVPQTGYYFSYWLDDARIFLERHDYAGRVLLLPFVSAIVASGIAYATLERYPHDLAFGLGQGEANRPSAAWRKVLEHGIPGPTEVREPLAVKEIQFNMIRPTIR